MENKRWYDKEPTLSLAVSLIKNSNDTTQQKCAEFIKNRAQDYGITLKSNLLGAFNYVLNRWYDSSEQLAEAFDYLKDADDETVKKTAFEQENVKAHTDGKNIVKIIVVKNKIVNIVVK